MSKVKNTGKASEGIFEDYWEAQGKSAFLFRFKDKSDIVGLNLKLGNSRKLIAVPANPADYMLTVRGVTGYAEVKSTHDPTAFRKSLMKPYQLGSARRQVAAGGNYWVYVHRVDYDTWYRIPAAFMLDKFERASSIPWFDLKVYQDSEIH
jgi:penicillin-binding protein-related factor A (putative recombinase)